MLKVVKVLERISSSIAALAILAMIVLSVANALGRTWFGWSIPAASEISSQWLLPLIVLLAIPGAQVWKEHYTVVIITERIAPRSLALLKGLGCSVGAVTCGALAWFGLLKALEKTQVGATAGITSLPVYPFYYLVPVGLAFTALVFVCDGMLAYRHPDGDLNTGTGEPLHDDTESAAH
jgi:TRAP-type C4-dicarboxylate transport system permease small subunit